MRSNISVALFVAALLAPGTAPAQSLGVSEINWCKWENPPLYDVVKAIIEMERQLEEIERAMGLMAVVEGFAYGGEDGPRNVGEMALEIEAVRTYARLGRLYDSRHHVLNCLYNKLEEIQTRRDVRRGPAGQLRKIGALKEKAGGLKQRRDRLGPTHDTIEAEPYAGGGYRIAVGRHVVVYRERNLRRISGRIEGFPRSIEFDFGFDYRQQWNPSYRIGANGAGRKLSADVTGFRPHAQVRIPLRGEAISIWNASAGIDVEGGTSDHERSGADLSGAGQIFSIDGTNRQNIVAARDVRLELNHHTVAIRAFVAARIREWDGGASFFDFQAGFQYIRDRWIYDFSQLVSGGGPFFLHAVRSAVASDFYGARLGATFVQRIAENVALKVAGHVTPGHQRDRLTATQFPGTFGPGTLEVGDRRSGFAVRTGISTSVEMRALRSLFIAVGIGYEHNSRVPRIDGLTGGRAQLGAGHANSLLILMRARIIIE